MQTITTWKGSHRFRSEQPGRAGIDIDAHDGFSPKALLLSGLAGCAGVDVVDILEKMRVEFTALEIGVEAEQTEDPPKVFKSIEMHFALQTGKENRSKVEKAIELSLEKYCGVAAMLRKGCAIEYRLTLRSEDAV